MVLQGLNLFEIHIFEDRKVTERRAEPLFVDRRSCPWGEEFKPCLAGMENLNLNRKRCQVFPAENKSFIFQYGDV